MEAGDFKPGDRVTVTRFVNVGFPDPRQYRGVVAKVGDKRVKVRYVVEVFTAGQSDRIEEAWVSPKYVEPRA